jgi:uncharacterized Zn-binding protein involved in type VI secretion
MATIPKWDELGAKWDALNKFWDNHDEEVESPGEGFGLPSARITDPIGHGSITGLIIGPCSPDVFVNTLMKARLTDLVFCAKHKKVVPNLIITGAPDVFVNGLPAARMLDKTTCGAHIFPPCSPDVFINAG